MHYNQYQNHPVSMNLIDLLCSEGVAQVKPLFSENTIKHWNALLDPAFAKQNAPRKYVSAIELLDMGLLNEIFNEQMLGIIFKLIPDAELYHCHVYEINGNNKEPHIKANNQLSGWHRDTDCKFRFFTPKPQHISIFVYLSDVSSTGGCFELTNKPLTFLPTGFKDEVYYKLIGQAGTSFLFDRTAYHRASPNLDAHPRRVLKISIQSDQLFNHKRDEKIFELVRNQLIKEDAILQKLFGDREASDNCNAQIERIAQKPEATEGFLPENQFEYKASFKQNMTRNIRDFRFLTSRFRKQFLGGKDNLRPTERIDSSKLN